MEWHQFLFLKKKREGKTDMLEWKQLFTAVDHLNLEADFPYLCLVQSYYDIIRPFPVPNVTGYPPQALWFEVIHVECYFELINVTFLNFRMKVIFSGIPWLYLNFLPSQVRLFQVRTNLSTLMILLLVVRMVVIQHKI